MFGMAIPTLKFNINKERRDAPSGKDEPGDQEIHR